MFLVNSRLGHLSAATFVAPLLPKLRGYFAEFLNRSSPVRLWILSSSTCVGLRYGHPGLVAAFLGTLDRIFAIAPHHSLPYLKVLYLKDGSLLGRAIPTARMRPLYASPLPL